MNKQKTKLRRKALHLILPILTFGLMTSAYLISNQNYDVSAEMRIYWSAAGLLFVIYLIALKVERWVFPITLVTLAITTFLIMKRVYEVNFGAFREDSGVQSLFIAVYYYLPILYLFSFMLLSRIWALAYSVGIWLAVLFMVYVANIEEFSMPVWREGLDYLVLIVGMCQPIYIAIIYAVPPYAEAVTSAKVETAEVKDALHNLEEIAFRDALTGLHNRRFLEDFWQGFSDPQEYTQQHLSLFIVDIDHFKEFNDTVGHLEGDECLQAIAQQLDKFASDFGGHACRYGGEEFVVIVPSEVELDALSLAEQIRYSVQDLKLEHPAKRRRFVTVSVGATSGSSVAYLSESRWMRAADAALYSAKSDGRNCSKFLAVTSD